MSTAGTPPRRRTAALLVRLLIPGLLVVILTESHAARTTNPINVVFALDMSDSNPSVDQGIAYVSDSARNHHRTKSGDLQTLVVFGKVAAVEVAPSVSLPLEAIESEVDRGATNLERALAMSLAVIHPDHDGRIVLISDGNQTDGDVSRIIPILKSRRIAVDALPVEYSYQREVWLEELELPQQFVLGETYDATVLLSANADGQGILTLSENGSRIAKQRIDYKAGQNRYTLPITINSVGYHEYFANLEVPRFLDSLPQNNTVMNSLYVDGDRKVLLVTGQYSDQGVGSPFAAAVSKTASAFEVITASGLAHDAQQLTTCDVIVFADVSRNEFDEKQLQAVQTAVEDYGVGFLMYGGANSFGPGGYHQTPIAEILPVSCDPSSALDSKAAMVVVLDAISSFDGQARGRELLKTLLVSLGSADELGVVIDQKGNMQALFPLTSMANRKELLRVIEGTRFDRFLSYQAPMKAALNQLLSRKVSARHVLIVSDGAPLPPTAELLQQYRKAGVTLSAVTIYPVGGADGSSMPHISRALGGKYYWANHPNQLAAIVDSEMTFLNRRALRQRPFVPVAGNESAMPQNLGEIPPLLGYVATTNKEGALTQVLGVLVGESSVESPEPLLTIWRHGLGKTAAFTSSFNGEWGEPWQKWPRFSQFVEQVLKELGRSKNLRISTRVADEVATIIVHDRQAGESPLVLEGTVFGPDQRTEAIALQPVAPQRYEARLPLWGHGRYRIAVTTQGDRHESTFGGFGHVVTYSPEHLQLSSNRQALQEITAATGGRILSGEPVKDAVYSQDIRTLKYVSQGSFDWFLIVLALLVPANVLCRRIWHDIEIARELRNLPPVPSPTMQALFKTKEWVTTALSAKGTARMLIQIWAPPPVRHASTPAVTTPEATHSTDSSSTTFEKLLAMKRQQNEHS